jgi:hypothetical protein
MRRIFWLGDRSFWRRALLDELKLFRKLPMRFFPLNWKCVLDIRNTMQLQRRQLYVSPRTGTRLDYRCYQYVWNQQPSNYNHPKPTTVASLLHSIRRPQSSGSRRPLCTPGRPTSNLLSFESIQTAGQGLITEQPVQTAEMFTERSRHKHNQMALFVLNFSPAVWRGFRLEPARPSDIQVRISRLTSFLTQIFTVS